MQDFVSRLFDGEAMPLVEYLIADHKLTADDIARLRAMLNQREQKDDELSQR